MIIVILVLTVGYSQFLHELLTCLQIKQGHFQSQSGISEHYKVYQAQCIQS